MDQQYFQHTCECCVEEGAINFASSIGVRGVPTMTVMKKGVEIDRIVGNPGEAKLKEFLDKNI